MSDWKSRAIPVTGTNDWKTRAQALNDAAHAPAGPADSQAVLSAQDANPGMLDSAMRGFEDQATLGLAPRVLAGGSALYDSLFNDANFADDYEKNKQYNDLLFKKSQELHPYAYGAGGLAGGAALAVPLGGANLAGEGIGGAMALGAATGAIQGGAKSNASDLSGQLEDAATGGLVGGALGGAAGLVADKFGDAISDKAQQVLGSFKKIPGQLADLGPVELPTAAFQQGLAGNRVYGKNALEQVGDNFRGAVNSVDGMVGDALGAATSNKAGLLTGSESPVDISSWANKAFDMLKAARANATDSADLADIEKLRGVISNFILGDEESGLQGRGLSIKATDAESFLRKLADYAQYGDKSGQMATPMGRALANRLISPLSRNANLAEQALLPAMGEDYSPLKQVLNDAVPGLSDANSDISQLAGAKDTIPSIGNFASIDNVGKAGLSAKNNLDDFFEALPDSMRGDVQNTVQDAATTLDVAHRTNLKGIIPGIITHSAKGDIAAGANMVGLGLKEMYNWTPEVVKDVASSISSIGGEAAGQLSALLSQAAERDHLSRNAIIFAIQQNPKYRAILSQHPAIAGVAQ